MGTSCVITTVDKLTHADHQVATSRRPSRAAPTDLTPSLVVRLRAGDGTAGALLNQFYRQPILRFCWGYLRNLDEAEDAVQEIFCKVLNSKVIPDNFRAFIYRIARNHCADLLRVRARKEKNQGLPPDSQLEAESTGNLSRLVRREQRSRIAHLVAALPADQREVLRLRYVEELTRAEIAYVLEISEKLVKSRACEGLKKLRQHTSLL